MDFSNALAYLNRIREAGAKLQLSNIQKIIDNFPFNLKKIKFIQVAGTNGKGSTSHFISSILIENGYRTGLFTSPHLENIRERISVNKKWITKSDFAGSLKEVSRLTKKLVDKNIIENLPTYFEHLFLLALFHFYKSGTEFVVLEVGLGGRLDATSTITPEVSIITNISKDHTKTLGKTIREIAGEKAGIIKSGVPVVTGVSPGGTAGKIIRQIAKIKNSQIFYRLSKNIKLKTITEDNHFHVDFSNGKDKLSFNVFLNGRHQVDNAVTAALTALILRRKGNNIALSKIQEGISNTFIPGRVEQYSGPPAIIIDSSHNEASVKALRNFLNEKKKKNLTLIFGVLGDKNYRTMAEYLLPYVSRIILTEPESKRALPSQKLLSIFKKKDTYVINDYMTALAKACEFNKEILITGSFYLSGKMKNLLSGGIR